MSLKSDIFLCSLTESSKLLLLLVVVVVVVVLVVVVIVVIVVMVVVGRLGNMNWELEGTVWGLF